MPPPPSPLMVKEKPTFSNEQVRIYNVIKHFKAHKPSDSQHSLFKHRVEATGYCLSTVRRIVKQKDGHKPSEKKSRNKIEEFNKLN